MLKILNVMVVGFLTIPLSSFGAVITYTSDVFSGSALGGSGVTVSIPQFNPALGNLSYIGYLQVSSIVTAVITVRGSIIPADGTCRDGGALLWLQITSSSSLFINNSPYRIVGAVSGFGCDQDNISTNVIPFPEYFYSGDRSSFIGAGSISIPLQLGYKLPLEDLWTRVGMRSLDWTGTVEITYGYQPAPTPEGSSLSLTLFGLCILFVTIKGRLSS